jgi:hypothetical protein
MENKAKTGGDCYVANGSAFLEAGHANSDNPKKLVHGIVINQIDHKPMSHCWIESGETVFDYSNGRKIVLPKMVYYSIGNITEENLFKYSYK